MIAAITFEFPLGWLVAIPLAGALALSFWRHQKRGLKRLQKFSLLLLRAFAFLLLAFLAARPVWIAKVPPSAASRSVALLVDRSESMALEEPDASRFKKAAHERKMLLGPDGVPT